MPCRVWQLVPCVLLLVPVLARADNETMDPIGRPKQFDQGKLIAYALWYEDGLWHLRVTAPPQKKGEFYKFTGSVRVEGDKIVGNVQGLEKSKKAKKADYVTPTKDQAGFDFTFTVSGEVDGVDFKGGEKAEKITFKLISGGDDDPRKVLVGPKGAHPSKGSFSLPARPTK